MRQLAYFAAAARHGSVTRAASELHVSQPSVSAAIQHLEDVLGVQLFVRQHAKGLVLTSVGRELQAAAETLLADAHALQTRTERSEPYPQHIDIGCFVTFAPLVFPGLIRKFRERSPNVTVGYCEGYHDELLEGLEGGRFELSLLYDLYIPDSIATERFLEFPLHLVLPRQHPLAAKPRISIRDLADEPYILLDLPYTRDYMMAAFTSAGIEPRVGYRTRSFEMVRSLVANGLGYSLLNIRPQTTRTHDGRHLVTRPVVEEVRPVRLVVGRLARYQTTRTADQFLDFCRIFFSGLRRRYVVA